MVAEPLCHPERDGGNGVPPCHPERDGGNGVPPCHPERDGGNGVPPCHPEQATEGSASKDLDAVEATFPVAERFVSINGEGAHAGYLAAFIRFTGCNLACSYCDTSWANVGECPHEDLSVDQLVEWVAGTGAACVTLTGGEPALQPGLPQLIEALVASDVWGGSGQRVVEIETNGAVDLGELDVLRRRLAVRRSQAAAVMAPAATAPVEMMSAATVPAATALPLSDFPPSATGAGPASSAARTRICFTMDCKMPSSGMAARMVEANYDLLCAYDAVKFVVGSRGDLEEAARVIDEHGLCERCTVFFSPVFSCIDPAEIVAFMEERHLSQVRLQLQLHKIIWPGVDKGV